MGAVAQARGCQNMSAYRVFRKRDVLFDGASTTTYEHRSGSSGKRVTLNFCVRCGTTLDLDMERFPDVLGLCGGTFDDPNWFHRSPGYRHIFVGSAQKAVVLPAGVPIYEEHALSLDGTPNQPHRADARTGCLRAWECAITRDLRHAGRGAQGIRRIPQA